MPTSRGIDVSSYQGNQDWAALARGGLAFAFAKASEGEHTHDAKFATHITGITAAGLVPGAYHFGWPNQPAATEAANYIAAVHAHRVTGFVHVLDLERRQDGANYKGCTAAQIRAYATAWIGDVRAAFPHDRIGVYTSGDDIAAGHLPANSGFLWYPAYPSGEMSYTEAEKHARPAPSGQHPLFWQFTSTPIDRDLAYLSPADLRTWAAGEETDMAITDADAKKIALAVASYSHGDTPDVHQTWATAAEQATAAAKGVQALAKGTPVTLSDAQLTTIAVKVAASPTLAAAIADRLAVDLAARLQS